MSLAVEEWIDGNGPATEEPVTGPSPVGSAGGRGQSVHPFRYSRLTICLTSGAFLGVRVFASHSTFFSAQTARLPSSTTSVSGPAYSGKFERAGFPSVMARAYSVK